MVPSTRKIGTNNFDTYYILLTGSVLWFLQTCHTALRTVWEHIITLCRMCFATATPVQIALYVFINFGSWGDSSISDLLVASTGALTPTDAFSLRHRSSRNSCPINHNLVWATVRHLMFVVCKFEEPQESLLVFGLKNTPRIPLQHHALHRSESIKKYSIIVFAIMARDNDSLYWNRGWSVAYIAARGTAQFTP